MFDHDFVTNLLFSMFRKTFKIAEYFAKLWAKS